jgi:hypothetical protein
MPNLGCLEEESTPDVLPLIVFPSSLSNQAMIMLTTVKRLLYITFYDHPS